MTVIKRYGGEIKIETKRDRAYKQEPRIVSKGTNKNYGHDYLDKLVGEASFNRWSVRRLPELNPGPRKIVSQVPSVLWRHSVYNLSHASSIWLVPYFAEGIVFSNCSCRYIS